MNRYNRDIFQIEYWCMTIEDISYVYNFFLKRIKNPHVEINCNYISGNNKTVVALNDLINLIEERYKEKDDLVSLEIQFTNKEKLSFKDLFLRVNFFDNWSEFEVRATDSDGSLKDWIAGTYEEMMKIKKKFELEEKYKKYFLGFVKNRDSILKYYVIFDPFGNIKKNIFEKEKKEINDMQKETAKIVLSVNGNNNFSNNSKIVDSFNKNQQDIVSSKSWNEKWWGNIIIGLLIALIAGFLIYNFGWNQ